MRLVDDIDAGPTVLTMRWAFERLFASAGRALEDYVQLEVLDILARHAWADGSQVDLFADIERSAAAFERFTSAADAEGYRRFCAYTERIFATVEGPFLRAERPSVSSIVTAQGLRGAMAFARIDWHRSMWRSLGTFFTDPRLRQLFGRYATYYGSSPFRAPATLNLIAHVERDGVWRPRGGMYALAAALERLARELGVEIRTRTEVEEITVGPDRRASGVWLRTKAGPRAHLEAAAVIVNAAPQALDEGHFGPALAGCVGLRRDRPRSLSAVTWTMKARTRGFDLAHHNVFFSSDYPAEFRALERGELPGEPTVYVCAQDRLPGIQNHGRDPCDLSQGERLLILVNAPARGDERDPAGDPACGPWSERALEILEASTFALMHRCGLDIEREGVAVTRTTPGDFEALFPASGGALYGFATHSMMAPFQRPAARTRIGGLYLAGGGTHPGAGVPMVCLSGQLAGSAALEDLEMP